jgi:hypothetical protein
VPVVKIGGVSATSVTVVSGTKITAVTPASATAGAKPVTVTTVGGTGTKASGYVYVALPTVSTVTPSSGPASGNTSIRITGTNLSGATVTVGGAAATSVVASATSITARTPAGTVGAQDVVVTTVGGSATKSGGFTYVASLTGDMPVVDGGSGPSRGKTRSGTGITARAGQEAMAALLTPSLENCLHWLVDSGTTEVDCAGVPCESEAWSESSPTHEVDTGDLDANGVTDLCQLRCGDLDLDGRIDMGDVSVLMTLYGAEPVLGIGDLDGDGQVGDADLVLILQHAVGSGD